MKYDLDLCDVEAIANEMLDLARGGKDIPAYRVILMARKLKKAIKPPESRAVMFERGRATCYGGNTNEPCR